MGKNKNKPQTQPESTKLTEKDRTEIAKYMNSFELPRIPDDKDWCDREKVLPELKKMGWNNMIRMKMPPEATNPALTKAKNDFNIQFGSAEGTKGYYGDINMQGGARYGIGTQYYGNACVEGLWKNDKPVNVVLVRLGPTNCVSARLAFNDEGKLDGGFEINTRS
jgi:hypothetical protein